MTTEISKDKPMFPISVLADILQVHQRTLRIYDNENILVPQRSAKNRRLYSLNDIEKAKFIQYLIRDLGLNLAGVMIVGRLLESINEYSKTFCSSEVDIKAYMIQIVYELGIDQIKQAENRERLSKRGRKRKV